MHIADGMVNSEAFKAVYEYCDSRNYKCKGCRYSIDKVNKNHSPYTECIFSNCPSSWGNFGKEL